YECGLGSSSYFGKTFRRAFGRTPGDYRRNWHDRDRN
ncbi:MAG TPA: AraC family transcriptional regulator, partial [Clostridiales bacterium]|nr:AraC family transcriptional regulator [Clostridiales bacterium]